VAIVIEFLQWETMNAFSMQTAVIRLVNGLLTTKIKLSVNGGILLKKVCC
jgi:hypothetical protein